MRDAHTNFAYSAVATAPSPATSGTSLDVTAGQGALFPAVPFNATIWPAGVQPLSTNAEIVRVTARTTDTLTITRAQESSSARTVVVGDQIAAGITVRTLTDAESYDDILAVGLGYRGWNINPLACSNTRGLTSQTMVGAIVPFKKDDVVTNLVFEQTTVAATVTLCRLGIYNSSTLALLASTTNDAALPTTQGVRSKALSSAYTILTTGVYYIAYLVVATTPGAILAAPSTLIASGFSPAPAFTQAGQADLPATADASSTSGLVSWVAWS